MNWFLSDPLQPFSVAALVLLGLVTIEVIGGLFGQSPSSLIDDWGGGELADGALGWLNLGRVPLLIVVMVMLVLFAAGGMLLQTVAARTIGILPGLVASFCAGGFTLAMTPVVSRAISRILPREETYALADEDLIGRVGTVTVGPLEAHVIGKISVTDGHGNRHFPRVRPADPGERIETGAHVLIVEVAGREYRVIRAPAALADDPARNGI